MGVQTDDGGADRVLVHMVPRVVSHSIVRTRQKHFVGAAVRVRKGKDGHVRQLCGPGITDFCRVVQSRFMFSNASFQQGLRRRRW
jgi:hypothetical protein